MNEAERSSARENGMDLIRCGLAQVAGVSHFVKPDKWYTFRCAMKLNQDGGIEIAMVQMEEGVK